MINNDFTVTMLNINTAVINWTTANVTDVSYLYINGVFRYGPIITGSVDRAVTVPWSDVFNKKVEIHDFTAANNKGRPATATVGEGARPLLIWGHVSTALRYRIYHEPADGSSPEAQIDEIFVRDTRARYFVESAVRLDEGWHFFRVESVDEFGNESVTAQWPYRAFRLPEPVNDLTIANGSGAGLFDFTIS